MTEHVTVLLKDGLGGRRQARLPLPFLDLPSLLTSVRQAFQPELDAQEFSLTLGTSRSVNSDASARKLRAGDHLQVWLGTPGSTMVPSSLPTGRTPGSRKGMSGGTVAPNSGRAKQSLGSGFKPPEKERISFVPHPKTLTMAGDYEYFSARGHHPFAFALAELVDNSLRATKSRSTMETGGAGAAATAGVGGSDSAGSGKTKSREIAITLLVNEPGTAGLIRVQDNGRGMSPKELGEWAVMNLSMEDRGLLPSGTQRALEQSGGGRFLSGDLSFFGVGSKNAAFFMGSSVKLATRQAGSESVHELYIAGAELERRYKNGENVYEEDMVHREPGDTSTLSKQESSFTPTRSWLAEEAGASSFTRVTITDLRPDVLSLIHNSESGSMVCRDLAHLYHYYLHGPTGNVGAGAAVDSTGGTANRKMPNAGSLPGGEARPNISVEYWAGSELMWRRELAEVDDDLESRYVRSAKAKMEFELDVPGKGTVEGVLWYFPFVDGAETVPRELGAAAYGGGMPGGGGLTQIMRELPTQLSLHNAAALAATQLARVGRGAGGSGAAGTQAGQLPEQMQRALADMLIDGDTAGEATNAQGNAPMFETFWQGRLIPGSGLDSLPYIDALRAKMRGSSSGKDYLPDDVFGRLRGALFFGPAWRVTRNKLTFRDSLPELLATATPSDRALDKRLREWLRDCHTRLDRILQFQGPADVELKAIVRKELGEGMTGFTRVSDGTRTISTGDVVRLSTKPAALGRVKYFSVPQANATEGIYATGFVTFTGLPSFLHGPQHSATLSIRRVEELVAQAVVVDFTARERAKMPSVLRLEPIRLASGRRIDVAVGDVIPETTVTLHNSSGQRLTRSFMQGQKVALRVRQRLIYMGPGRPSAYCSGLARSSTGNDDVRLLEREDQVVPQPVAGVAGPSSSGPGDECPSIPPPAAEVPEASGAGKRGRKRRKKNEPAEDADAVPEKENRQPGQAAEGAKKAKRGNAPALASPQGAMQSVAAAVARVSAAGPLPEGVGEVVLLVENKTPIDNSFQFSKITGGFTMSGTYFLEYSMIPELPAGCDPNGGTSPMAVWSRTILYAAAGPPVRFELRGEARALLAAKSIVLGEVLPPLQLVGYDAQGNTVSLAGTPPPGATSLLEAGAPRVSLELLAEGGDDMASSRRLEEVQLEWQAAHTAEVLVVQGLRLQGRHFGKGGLRIFRRNRGVEGGVQPSYQSFDRTPGGAQDASGALERSAVSDVALQLRISVADMPSQVLSLKLRPGAPACLRLLPRHPFGGDAKPEGHSSMHAATGSDAAGMAPAYVMNGDALPEFQVLVLDAWGNTTCPTPDLPCTLQLEGPVLQPSTAPFAIDPRGVATVQGVRVAAPDSSLIGVRQEAELRISCSARGCGPRAALEVAEAAMAEAEARAAAGAASGTPGPGFSWSRLSLPIMVQPCTLPAGLQLHYQGQPCEVGPSASGDGLVAVIRGVSAGSQLIGLSLVLLDEGGRPAEPGFKGKLQVSWTKGTKKVTVSQEGARLDLPAMSVREQVSAEPQSAWIRFVGDGPLLSAITLETSLEVFVVAGPPASWGVSLVSSGSSDEGGGMGAGRISQATENLGFVACGGTVCLDIEAHDAYGNRCNTWAGTGPRPTPEVIPTRDQADSPLLYDRTGWVCGWDLSQHSGVEVYRVRLALGGSVGPVKLVVRDSQGPGGESLLQPDELPVELQPGPPTTLAFDGPQQLQCGTRGCLGDVRLRVTDDWGNLVETLVLGGRGNKEGAGLEVTMSSSAIATDGSGNAAKVTVAGSNKTKVTKGCATFRDVKVEGNPGTYALRVGSASRKVSLHEAKLVVEVVAQNLVRHVAVAPCSLPQEPLEPGSHLELQVEVTTEDGMPLPFEPATAGLTLRLKAPSPEAAAAARGQADGGSAAGGGAGPSGSSAAACTVILQPQPPDAGASQSSAGLWTFVTPGPLVVAGEYSVTAEYTELRPELTRALPKSELCVRSVSHALELLPGPPVRVTLEQDPRAGSAAGPIPVTNGSDSKGRNLLSNVAVQLRDENSNAVALDGVFVRWVLGWPGAEDAADLAVGDGGPGPAPQSAAQAGAELPSLEGPVSEVPGAIEALTDSRGRAFFSDVAVVEGTGRVGAVAGEDTPQALYLELRLHAALHPSGGPSAGGPDGWLCCWSAPVVFSDDAARAATLQRLCARREELAGAVARYEDEKGAADRVLDAAQQAVRHAQSGLNEIERRAGHNLGNKPERSAQAREALHRVREQHQKAASASQQRKDTVSARFGPSTSGMVMALNRCLAAAEGHGEVVGVIAQLATVDNPYLSALLSAAFSATLQILVVRSYECIKRLREMLTNHRNQLPSMLAINMVQGFTGDGRQAAEVVASMRNMSQEAIDLRAAASDGVDPPLPMLLPHTRMLLSAPPERVHAMASAGPAADEWPHGCLGYAVNLVRPAVPGHRASIFYSQFGRTLVFETLDQAAAYRTFVVQTLGCSGLGDIYTLDGGKLSGRGVVVGSGFRVIPLEDAVVRFGAAQSSQTALAKQFSQQILDLEAYAAALEAVESASEAEAQAQEAAAAAEQQLDATRAEVAEELQQLEAEITRLAGDQPGGSGLRAGARQRGGRGPKRRRDGHASGGATAAGDTATGQLEDPGCGGADGAAEAGPGRVQEGTRAQRSKRTKGQGRK